MKQTTAFLGIGANLVPDGYDSLHSALSAATDKLSYHVTITKRSSWYRTSPIPKSDQPDFLNAVLQICTGTTSDRLLEIIHNIEVEFGRVRTVRNAARVLDIDILSFGNEIREDEHLTIPHPRLAERSFVLVPWAEIAPEWCHPIYKETIHTLCQKLSDSLHLDILDKDTG